MDKKLSAPVPRLTVITLGVNDMRASIAFYEALGFERKFRSTGEVVAFFETGGPVLGLFPWKQLAEDVTLPEGASGADVSWHDARLELTHDRRGRHRVGFCSLQRSVAVEACA
jgi:catechol 2,3-dioxygenase-like lactoylglutathione lyase family enzyme